MNIRPGPAVIAGSAATAVMTVVGLWVAPIMGLPPTNPAVMLAGGSMALAWMGHLMIGTILAVIYAVARPYLPGPPVVRGATYGLAPFLMAQLIVMPMMGMPVFSGSATMAIGKPRRAPRLRWRVGRDLWRSGQLRGFDLQPRRSGLLLSVG
jgi:hypothetical protein